MLFLEECGYSTSDPLSAEYIKYEKLGASDVYLGNAFIEIDSEVEVLNYIRKAPAVIKNYITGAIDWT